MIAVRPVTADWIDKNADALGAILAACVADGASVSFLAGLDAARGADFWRARRDAVAQGDVALLVAFHGDAVLGTVMVMRAGTENQPHRGDVAKLLVDPAARGRGAGEALMRAAEAEACAMGLTLLVLDTAGAVADRLYRRLAGSRWAGFRIMLWMCPAGPRERPFSTRRFRTRSGRRPPRAPDRPGAGPRPASAAWLRSACGSPGWMWRCGSWPRR